MVSLLLACLFLLTSKKPNTVNYVALEQKYPSHLISHRHLSKPDTGHAYALLQTLVFERRLTIVHWRIKCP